MVGHGLEALSPPHQPLHIHSVPNSRPQLFLRFGKLFPQSVFQIFFSFVGERRRVPSVGIILVTAPLPILLDLAGIIYLDKNGHPHQQILTYVFLSQHPEWFFPKRV